VKRLLAELSWIGKVNWASDHLNGPVSHYCRHVVPPPVGPDYIARIAIEIGLSPSGRLRNSASAF
jgi:hypothetical protein